MRVKNRGVAPKGMTGSGAKGRSDDGLQRFLSEIRETTLPNGIKLLIRPRRKSSLATFQVWYRVGSRNESVGRTGISHLLEHMMFKGTDKVRPEEFSRIIQREGGQTNAFTTKDVTAYFVLLASDRIPVALRLERDRMSNLRLRSRDFLPERMVVMEERRLRTDTQPEGTLLEEVEAAAFLSHPYRWPIIGWMEDIREIGIADVRQYRAVHYIPSNILMVAVGDLEPRATMDMVASHFGDIPSRKTSAAAAVTEPVQGSERRVIVRREAKVPYLAIAHHTPRLGHPDGFALEVLACMLARGRSARLYRRLVAQDALVLNVDADYPLLSLDPGLFTITARILPDRSIESAESSILQELDSLARGEGTEEELEKAKRQLEASFVFSLDSLMNQALLLAEYEMCGGWRLLGEYLPGIRGVTMEAIRRVLREYFVAANRCVGWLVPRSARGS